MIISSFLSQYNIYLPKVRNWEMSFAEFCYRLTGLNDKTPLMVISRVRTEDDPKVIKHWPDKLKSINNEWKVKQYNNITPEDLERHKEIEQKRLQRFFEACAK